MANFDKEIMQMERELIDLRTAQPRAFGSIDFYTKTATVVATVPPDYYGDAFWSGKIRAAAKNGEVAPFFMQLSTSAKRRYTSFGINISERQTEWEISVLGDGQYNQNITIAVQSSCDIDLYVVGD